MFKKILIILFILVVLGYGLFRVWSSATHFEWGHHFSFENDLGIEIDSLLIAVGDRHTLINSSGDNLRTMEGNIEVPENDYPHKVEIFIYSGKDLLQLKADSFNCFNCDGSHLYILNDSGAKYKFLN